MTTRKRRKRKKKNNNKGNDKSCAGCIASGDNFPNNLSTGLNELVKEVDPSEQLDEEVEDILLQIADDFIEQTVSQACALAKHRKANTIDGCGSAI